MQIDFARPGTRLRALHGINKGPLTAGGLQDLSKEQRALGLPFLRLHDCHWPNPDVVDIHVVFPDFNADPERPESYDFRLTDEYLAAAHATGSQMIYRLGESIEHTTIKRFVHPPKDPAKWAAIALGIIRHYNEGWANGFHYHIPYWEIWNEPENRPAMWSGTDEAYFQLYLVTAKAIKARYPDLKVGGPAVGNSGGFEKEAFRPSAFVTAFLEFCQREKAPLDFFSWHCYTADPVELSRRAGAIRELLNKAGWTRTESHLNEWNYLPDNRWDPLSRSAAALDRQRFYERMSGAEGAAFVAAALMELQEAPVDVCALFHGEVGGFGLFTENGVPNASYQALLAFHQLLETPQAVTVTGQTSGVLTVRAGLDANRQHAAIFISNRAARDSELRLELQHLPWKEDSVYDIQAIDAAHPFTFLRQNARLKSSEALSVTLKAPGVVLIKLRPAND